MTKLFMVEGVPGSGKSSTAKYIADRLEAKGRNVLCVDEGSGDHPADYEDNAYITGHDLAAFPPGLRERVRTSSEHRLDGYVVPMAPFGGAAGERLKPYKIYESLSWEAEMPLFLDKWARFVNHVENAKGNPAYVFNCVFLQNPMCETMMRFGKPEEESLAFVSQIAERIAPLDPVVVYLKNDEIAQSIQAVAPERGDWLDEVIAYHVSGAYGRSINAQGFEGYIACLEERQRRELSMLEKLPVRSLVVDNAQRDWDGAHEKIRAFLGL